MPEENFYFFKIFSEDTQINKQRNEIEKQELIRLIENHQNFKRYFLKKGELEPVQILDEERDLLVDGM